MNQTLKNAPALVRAISHYAEGDSGNLEQVVSKHAGEIKKKRPDIMAYVTEKTTPECVSILARHGLTLTPSLDFPVDLHLLRQNSPPEVFQKIMESSPRIKAIVSPVEMVRIKNPTQEIIDSWERSNNDGAVALFDGELIKDLRISAPAIYINCQIEESTLENAVIKEKFNIGYSKIRDSLIFSKRMNSLCIASNLYRCATVGAHTTSCRFYDGLLRKGEHMDARFASPGTFIDPDIGGNPIRSIEKTSPTLTKMLASVAGCEETAIPRLLDLEHEHYVISTKIRISQFTTHIPLPGSRTEMELQGNPVKPPPECRTVAGAVVMEPAHRAYIMNMLMNKEVYGVDVFHYMMLPNGSLAKSREYLGPPLMFAKEQKEILPRLFKEDLYFQKFREICKRGMKKGINMSLDPGFSF